VALHRVPAQQLAAAGHLEALLRCFVRLLLRHLLSPPVVLRLSSAEQHDHVAPVLERRRFDLPDLLDVLGEAHQEVSSALGWLCSRPRNMIVTFTFASR
jgi:hypothetical protein